MPKNSKVVCIIVDAYSTGRYIAPTLIGYGYKCIHIQSSKSLPKEMVNTLIQNDFIKTLLFEDDIEKILFELKEYTVKLCIPGYESGVELADTLSAKFNLPVNDISLTKSRRHKWDMIETISAKNLLTAKHFKSNNPEEIINWIKSNNIKFPIVLKPISSANGDNVHFCQSLESVQGLCQKILSKEDCFGEMNKEVLAETFLDGQEYIVNSVSCEGQHKIVETWRVNRKPLSTIYETCEMIDISDPLYVEISEYAKKVLSALGVSYGAATTELKYTSGGVSIIETAARLMGGAELSFSTEILGHNQLTLMLESYLNPEDFLLKINQKPRSNKHYGLAVLLISNVEGGALNDPNLKELMELKSLFSFKVPSKGDKLVITIDSLTDAGFVYLLSDNKEELQQDTQKIRDIEKTLYKDMIYAPQIVSNLIKLGLTTQDKKMDNINSTKEKNEANVNSFGRFY